jgi:hypothetical protein
MSLVALCAGVEIPALPAFPPAEYGLYKVSTPLLLQPTDWPSSRCRVSPRLSNLALASFNAAHAEYCLKSSLTSAIRYAQLD